jgi:enoyl-CoA hydratase/carnithine racemase
VDRLAYKHQRRFARLGLKGSWPLAAQTKLSASLTASRGRRVQDSRLTGRDFDGVDVRDSTVDSTRVDDGLSARTDLQHRLGKPSIAAVNGTARGGGMTLAISCDMAVVDRDADLGYPEIDVGVIPAIHFAHLPRIVGRHRAFDLLFTGRAFGAQEAWALGLAARIAEPGTALDTAHELARVLAAKPRRVLRMAREAFLREVDAGGGYRHGVATAVETFCNVAATPESQAGIRAFVDRPRRTVDREPR